MSTEGRIIYQEGVSLENAGDISGAFAAYRRSAKVAPGKAAPYVGLARILTRNHQRPDAIACLKRAVACEPDNATVRIILGQTLAEDGQLDAARQAFEYVLRDGAMLPNALLGLGSLYEDLGDRSAAADLYHCLLDAHPDNAAGIAGLLAVAKGEALTEVISVASKRLKIANDVDVALIGSALGKALARSDKPIAAFDAWSRANEARRRESGAFDRGEFDRRIDQLCKIFSADFVAERRDYGQLSERPVFIVGLPRSGTTLTEQILSAHADVYGAGELDVLSDLATGLPDRLGRSDPPWPEAVEKLTMGNVGDIGSDYLRRISELSSSSLRVIDKQPLNFWHLGLVAIAMPNARIIHCRRDIRDCGLSIFSENFTPQQRWATDLGDIAHYWRGYRRLMEHWRNVSALSILDIVYETLVDDVETQSRRLFDFMGLPWDRSVLDFHTVDRAVQTPSRWQVRQPLYKSSSGRWRPYEAMLKPLISAAEDI